MFLDCLSLRVHHHPGYSRGSAGGHRISLTFDFYYAQTTGPKCFQPRVVAECWHLDIRTMGHLIDGLPFGEIHFHTV